MSQEDLKIMVKLGLISYSTHWAMYKENVSREREVTYRPVPKLLLLPTITMDQFHIFLDGP